MKRLSLFATLSFVLAGCNGGPNKTNIEIIQNMMDTKVIKSQGWVPDQGDKVQMLNPPDHTVSRGNPPFKYQNDPAGAEKMVNPFKDDQSAEFKALGKETFTTYCQICHGEQGKGDGKVSTYMAVKPRNLMSPDALAYPDGRIYYAITAGKGVMGSYISQIPEANRRWAVVNYVRSLQRETK